MTYTLHYADEKTLRRQLTAVYARTRMPLTVTRLLITGLAAYLTSTQAGPIVGLIVAGMLLCLFAGVWCYQRKQFIRLMPLRAGSTVTLTRQENGLRTECEGITSFRPWSDLRLVPQRQPQDILLLADKGSGSFLLLPLTALSEEECRALTEDIDRGIRSAKEGTCGAPEPSPEGYGASCSLSPKAYREGMDILIRRLYPWYVPLNAVVLTLLWPGLSVLGWALFEGVTEASVIISTVAGCGILLIFLGHWRHPGAKGARRMRRYLMGDTWSLRADGSTLLRRKPSGAWSVIPLSFYTHSLRGQHALVMLVRNGNGMPLPPELLNGAAIPPPLPAPRPRRALTLLLTLLPTALLLIIVWAFLSLNASTDEKYGLPAWVKEQDAMIEARAEAQVNAAAPEEVVPEVRALIAQWQLKEQLEEQWGEYACLESCVMNLNEDEKLVNFISFITPLNRWYARFPEQTRAAISAFPESVQSDVRDYLRNEEDEED